MRYYLVFTEEERQGRRDNLLLTDSPDFAKARQLSWYHETIQGCYADPLAREQYLAVLDQQMEWFVKLWDRLVRGWSDSRPTLELGHYWCKTEVFWINAVDLRPGQIASE